MHARIQGNKQIKTFFIYIKDFKKSNLVCMGIFFVWIQEELPNAIRIKIQLDTATLQDYEEK
jgi:hypothetical protein